MKSERARPKWRHLARWLIRLRGSPRAIALGVGIGVFVAFTPTIGFQTVIALVLATLLNANRPAAMALVWVTNPLTIPPCFALTYWVGSLFWPGPSPAAVSHAIRNAIAAAGRHDFWEMYDQFTAFLGIGRDVLIPLLTGGVVVGVTLGSVAYVLILKTIEGYRKHRAAGRGRGAVPCDCGGSGQTRSGASPVLTVTNGRRQGRKHR
jgi:uncharacterized protein (DUF2062 family)